MFNSPDMYDEMVRDPRLAKRFWDAIPRVDQLPEGKAEGDACILNGGLWIFIEGLWNRYPEPIPE